MIKKFVSCIAVIALSAIFAFGTTVIVPTDNDLIVGSRLIIRGKVIAKETRQDNPTMAVFTYTTLEVVEVYKGQLSAKEIKIKEAGGCFNGNCSIIFGIPEYVVNEEVIVFLDTWADGSLRTYQWFLGKYKIEGSQVSRDLGLSKVNILNLKNVSQNKENLETFAARIKSRVVALRSRSTDFAEKYYRGISVKASPEELKNPIENFTFLNPNTPMRWFEPDSNLPVNFRVNTQGMAASFTISHLNQSLAAWSVISGSSLRLANGGNTSGCGLLTLDGENTISFNNCDNYSPFSPPAGGCSGVLAAAGIIQYSPFQTKVVNGITFYRAIEANVSFNPYASCHFGNSCNVQEIMVHEVGHAGVGLGHSLDDTATMRAFAHFDGRCASIKTDDETGVRFIYPSSGNPTPTPIPQSQIAKRGNFDSDSKADPAIWNPQTSYWYVLNSSNNSVSTYFWGTGLNFYNDQPAVADFDNDLRNDVAVFRWLNGYFHIILSSGGFKHHVFGQRNDIPLAGNWDNDKRTDFAVYRPSGVFYILQSSTNTVKTAYLGGLGWQPVKIDIDGDSVLDLCVYGNNGTWNYITSSNDQYGSFQLGTNTSTPVPADYFGIGKDSFAVWEASTGCWSIYNSQTGQVVNLQWGLGDSFYGDVAQPADYFAGTDAEIAVYRRRDFNWYIKNLSSGQYIVKTLGQANAVPVTY